MNQLISYLKNKKIDYEIYSVFSSETSSEIFNDKVSFVSSGNTCSLGVRVAIGKKTGFSYTDDINGYKKCADAAIASAKNSEDDMEFPGFNSHKICGRLKPAKSVLEITPEWLTKMARQIMLDAKNSNNGITVPEGETSKALTKIRLVNSEGLDAEESYGMLSASASFLLKSNGFAESVGIAKASREKIDFSFGNEAAERLNSLSVRKSIKSGNYQLLLHPEELASILSKSYAFSISAENVSLKKSRLADKLNQQAFSKKIEIADDGRSKNLLGSRSFDAEGTKTRINTIIKNGTLKQFISDRKHANITNNSSTGNAARGASSLPEIATNNIIVKPGIKKDIFAECDNAIYVRGLLGVHTMNDATGDFSLGVQEGHLIRNGKIISPLKGAIIAGNFFKLMESVAEMSKNTEDVPCNGCSYKLPYILFENIFVTS